MSRRTSIRWAAAIVAALLLTVLQPTAQAVPTWLAPTPVSGDPATLTVAPRLALDRFGNATVVWQRTVGPVSQVRASHRPAGGTWSPPVTISDPDRYAANPTIGVDATGTVTAAWSALSSDSKDQVEAASLPLGGAWGPPGFVSESSFYGPSVAVDAACTATVVFVGRPPTSVVRASSRLPGGTWSPSVPISAVSEVLSPQVAVDPASGALTATWQAFDGSFARVHVNRKPAGGAWGEDKTISETGRDGILPEVAVDGQGTSTVVWRRYDGGRYEAAYSLAAAGSPWTQPDLLSPVGEDAGDVDVASGPGRTVIAWLQRADGQPSVARTATRGTSGGWSSPATLSDPAQPATAVYTAMAPDGTAHAMWTSYDGTTFPFWASRQAPGAGWTAPEPLVADAFQVPDLGAALAVDGHGDAAAAFATPSSNPDSVVVRALDATGPLVATPVVPANGVAQQPTSFSASATDVWSGVASYAWSFGDGTTATGPGVSHTYAAAGSYPVTLTVTDAVGNATTRTATTLVADPVPDIATFTLTKKRIATDEKTKLKVRLTTSATVKIVLKSKHKHLVKGKKKRVKVVISKRLPAGLSKVAIKGKKLKPDRYAVVGTATNPTGTSPRKKTKLVVVRPSSRRSSS